MEEQYILDNTWDTELMNMIQYSLLIDSDSKQKLLNNPLTDEIKLLLMDFFDYHSPTEEEIIELINQESSKIISKMLDYIQNNDKELEYINLDQELLI